MSESGKKELTHEEAFAVLDAVALDALDAAEREAVLAHTENCDICRVELSQLRDAAAHLAFSAPAPSGASAGSRERIHARLMARASAEYPKTAVQRPASAKETRGVISMLAWRRAEWVAIAASILLVAAVSVLASLMRDRENLQTALNAQIARGQRAVTASESLHAAVMTRDSIIAGLTGKDVAMMTLTSSGTRAPFAHMFWDKAHNIWTLVAHNMPELKPGRTYQLWLVTPTAKISAGTFAAVNGDAMVRATYPLSADQLKAIAVTEEPAGGMPQPTGAMVMVATAQ